MRTSFKIRQEELKKQFDEKEKQVEQLAKTRQQTEQLLQQCVNELNFIKGGLDEINKLLKNPK